METRYENAVLEKNKLSDTIFTFESFTGSNIRGADFSNSDLTGAKLINVEAGIPLNQRIGLFLIAIIVSLTSGYLASIAGNTLQNMLNNTDRNVQLAGLISLFLNSFYIVYCIWKGIGASIKHLLIPVIILSAVLALFFIGINAGTGKGLFYLSVSLLLVAIMFIIGTIARTIAGSMSNILFTIVAISGAIFTNSLGGGLGTGILALACLIISKRAIKGEKGFEGLHKISSWITKKFGTSFRGAILTNANFMGANLHNTDFTGAKLDGVIWENAKKVNIVID